jgi:hypothetical protein
LAFGPLGQRARSAARGEAASVSGQAVVQKHNKKHFTKNRPKVQNRFFLDFFYHVFGRFSVRGVQKHDKKNIEKINLTLVLFWPLTHPPTTGVTDLFLIGGGPLVLGVELGLRYMDVDQADAWRLTNGAESDHAGDAEVCQQQLCLGAGGEYRIQNANAKVFEGQFKSQISVRYASGGVLRGIWSWVVCCGVYTVVIVMRSNPWMPANSARVLTELRSPFPCGGDPLL